MRESEMERKRVGSIERNVKYQGERDEEAMQWMQNSCNSFQAFRPDENRFGAHKFCQRSIFRVSSNHGTYKGPPSDYTGTWIRLDAACAFMQYAYIDRFSSIVVHMDLSLWPVPSSVSQNIGHSDSVSMGLFGRTGWNVMKIALFRFVCVCVCARARARWGNIHSMLATLTEQSLRFSGSKPWARGGS